MSTMHEAPPYPMDIDKGGEEPIKFSSRARLRVLPRLIGVQIILLCSQPPFQSALTQPLATLCFFSSYVWVAHQHISPASTMPKPTCFCFFLFDFL